MKIIIITALLLLYGCDTETPSFHADTSDPDTGIQIEYRSGIQYPLEKIVAAYIKVETCMGMAAYPGPNIVIQDDLISQDVAGYTYYHPPLIIVYDDGLVNDNTLTLQHEMVHYILLKNGFPDNENSEHLSPLFWWCGDRIY